MSNPETIEYDAGTLSPANINTQLAEFWEALAAGDSDIVRLAEEARIDLEAAAVGAASFSAAPEEAGFDPGTIIVVIVSSGLPMMVARDLWKEVALPWIKHRTGVDAIGSERTERRNKKK